MFVIFCLILMRISQNSPNKTSYQFWFRKDCVTLFSCCCFHLQIIAEINKILKRTQRDLYFYCSVKKLQYFGVKTFPAWDMKRCYLQKKICATIRDLKKGLIRDLHCDFRVYEKNTLASIFKWLVAWKRRLPRPKFLFENLSPSSTLSYTITKKPKRVNLRRKSHWGSWSSWGSPLIALSLGFTVIRVLFRFLIERILFRVLSDRVFFESSQIGSSFLGYAAIDSSRHQYFFFRHVAIFYQIV